MLPTTSFFLFFRRAGSMWEFPGQGLNPCHSSDPNHSSDKAIFLTHCTPGELYQQILHKPILPTQTAVPRWPQLPGRTFSCSATTPSYIPVSFRPPFFALFLPSFLALGLLFSGEHHPLNYKLQEHVVFLSTRHKTVTMLLPR